MQIFSIRKIFLWCFLLCIGLFSFALYLQFKVQLDPCPLCVLQRLVVLLIGLTSLVAWLHNPHKKGTSIYYLLLLIFSLCGILIAGRHVWIQFHPELINASCGPDLGYLLRNLPLTEAFKMIFVGSAECGKISWTFLGLSIPSWTLISFIFFALLFFIQLIRTERM